ncbi:nose resistant to fluoxetine protein 6-like [Drosophila santomea]|uniref:nose resistant to fluoxetine protein 6-like n=1 Tax=Drosophila santomea TaxID=129105 RepID=UPI001954772F|nr:nose resistant to fluoxetine protein 6-like [Drosophila santomea]
MVRLALILGLGLLAVASVNAEMTNMFAMTNTKLLTEHFAGDHSSFFNTRRLSVEFFDYYSNVTLEDLTANSRIPSLQDLVCLADLALLSDDLSSSKFWALKMIDSWGLLPSGMLVGNWWNLGNFDECIAVDHAVTSSHSIKGKYCISKLAPAPSALPAFVLKSAVCFPASCSAANMNTMLRRLFQKLLSVELGADVQLVAEETCQTSEKKPYDGLTIFTIVMLSILGALVGLSTIFDYFFCKDEKTIHPVVKAFSARANSRSLFRIVDTKANANVIDCLHGIRCLSFIWVVYGHDYMVFSTLPNINMGYLLTWINSFYSSFIKHAVYAVDSFFFLSGLLLVVIALRSMDRTKGKLNIPMMYLHRYLRLTPILAFGILVYLKILPLWSNGPLKGSVGFDDYSVCENTWYWTLLYVQNYATSNLCLSHTWYLAVDMQLYIFAPFLLICLHKWGKKAAAGIFVLMLLLAGCLFSIMVINDLSLGAGTGESMRRLYYATQTRASPYLIGILFGYFLHTHRGKDFRLNRLAALLGWLIALTLIASCLFSVYGQDTLPIVEEAFYLSLSRIAWPLALCWVIFACMQGYGGLASSFLSSPLWQPLSKLSYSAYIFHKFIESLNGEMTHTSTYFSDYQVMLRFWPDFGFTILFSYLMHILIEAPFAALESLLIPTKRTSAKPDAVVEPRMPELKAPVEESPLEEPAEATSAIPEEVTKDHPEKSSA